MAINLKVPEMKELRPRITVLGVGGAGGYPVEMVGAPLGHEPQGAGQLVARPGELVGESRRPRRVGPGHDHTDLLEALQALGQDVGGDAGDVALELAEAPGTAEQGVDHEEAPAIAHPGQSRGQGGGARVALEPLVPLLHGAHPSRSAGAGRSRSPSDHGTL